jgi:hypothetical protein
MWVIMCERCYRALDEYIEVERSIRGEYDKATAQYKKEQAWVEYLKVVAANHPEKARK